MVLVAHKYMPAQVHAEELRATFAARHYTLDYLLKALRDQSEAKTLTSYVITGPRGAGKTTLILMLCLRIKEDPDLSTAWLPVRFPEELPSVTSLRDLLAGVLQVLADEGVSEAAKWYAEVDRESDEARSRDMAITGLRTVAESRQRRLILFVDNLDLVFDRALDADSQAKLRGLLMTDPFMLIVGTAVHLFEELRTYDRAFFNYFCPVPLERLDDEQVYDLLSRRARWDKNEAFGERYRRYRPEVQAISRLTGGNPRLVLMLYEILSHGKIASAVETLRQLIDELTPLLKDIVEHQLAGQQSKIVDALMRAGGTATPADLARATRLPLNTVTTQLRRLKDAQVLELRGGGKGRAAYYTVADQLFATWYQMRYLRPHRRKIEMFIEVLRIWFKAEERLEALRSLVAGAKVSVGTDGRNLAVAAEYFAGALAGTDYANVGERLAVESWPEVGETREAAFALSEFRPAQTVGRLIGEVGAYVTLGRWLREHGDLEKAATALKAAVEQDPRDLELLFEYGGTLGLSGDHQGAIRILDEVLSRTQDTALRAKALFNRGGAHRQQGDLAAAIADWTGVVELDGASADFRALAFVSRGTARDNRQSGLAFADWLAAAQESGAATEVRLLGASAGLRSLWREKDRVEALLNALRATLVTLGGKERFSHIIGLLASLASPEMRAAWPTVWRTIAASEPAEVVEQIRFFDAVAEALERDGDLSSLDPLPPEQREFSLEVLRKFDPPAKATERA